MSDEHGSGRDLFAVGVSRPVALGVLFLTMIVIGAIAYVRTPIQLLPSGFQEPRLNVWVPNPGASARENEERVARPIEEQMRTLAGIEGVHSFSSDDNVRFWIEFDPSLDLDLAKAEVRDRIERARPSLPDSVEEIGMWSEDADQFPIAFFGVLHPDDEARSTFLMDKIVEPRLEAVDGVSNVDIWGLGQDSVRILLDEEAVTAANLDVRALIQRMASDNFASPLGDMDDGGRWLLLRSDMRFQSLEEIAAFPIGDGLTVGDVAEVRRVQTVRNQLSRIDGSFAYFGMATKESQANVVEASRAFRAAIEEIEADPSVKGELEFVPFFVQGDMIENSLSQLRNTALWGGALAVLVLLVFLRRLRLTLCVALSIPVSTLMAIAWQYFTGQSFHVLTMTGVTLAIGMLVDNAVVVVENIARLADAGTDPKRAAARGAREIALAVTLATLTTVVVFLPLVFMSENPQVRTIFGGIVTPMVVSLLFSLLVALVFLPVVTARALGRGGQSGPGALARGIELVIAGPLWVCGSLAAVLRALSYGALCAMHRLNRLALALLAGPQRFLLALGVLALAGWVWTRAAAGLSSGLEAGWRPAGGSGRADQLLMQGVAFPALLVAVLAILAFPLWRRRPAAAPARPARFRPEGDSPLDWVISSNQRLLAWALEHRFWAMVLAFLTCMSVVVPLKNMEFTAMMQEEGDNDVGFRVALLADFTLYEAHQELLLYEDFIEERRERWGISHWNNRFDERGGRFQIYWEGARDEERMRGVEEELREELPRKAGHDLRFYDEDNVADNSRQAVRFVIRGPDSERLEELGAQAVDLLAQVPGLSGISDPQAEAPEELEVVIDRDRALSMNVLPEVVTGTIHWALRGQMLPRYHDDNGQELPFLVEFDKEDAPGMRTLRDLSVFTESGQVPLTSFAKLRTGRGSRTIYRRNGKTTFSITARVDDPTQRTAIESQGYAALSQLELPRGFELGNEDSARRRQEEEFAELQAALGLSIVLVFLLMGILFESVLLPTAVITAIPFAVVGAIWTIFLSRTPMDTMGWIGIIILAGVVVNNGIVLVDRIHRLIGEGMERKRAVLEGCAQRVRPILMTALTTVFGLLPMAVSEPATNAVPYRALATIVAGGLITSTFFTLWVVPVAYTLLVDLQELRGKEAQRALKRPSRWMGGWPIQA